MGCRLCILPLLALALGGCGGEPVVIRSQAFPSPDGAYTATLEEVDNGLGFGQGALYDEVHLTRQGESTGRHGDPGRSVGFYAESTYKNGGAVKIEWLDRQHLRVKFGGEQRPGRISASLNGVAIEYRQTKP